MSNGILRKQAYEHIQRQILSGQFAAGERISEQRLAEEFGISRTPIRSAIRQLESEGLLEQVPRYGTIVRKLERRDLAELYDLRVALEGFAAEAAATRITPDDLDALASLCQRMRTLVEERLPENTTSDQELIARFVDADMQFHLVILRATGNRRMMKSVADSRTLSQWGHFAHLQQNMRFLAEIWEQHEQIGGQMRDGDADGARIAMVRHIRFSKEEALRVYDRLQAEGDAAEILAWAMPSAMSSHPS